MAAAQRPSSPFGRKGLTTPTPKQPIPATKPKKTPIPILLLSSTIAGGVEAVATYPFEYAKTIVQLQTASGLHHNPFSVITNIVRYEGLGAIYTGCSTLVLGTAFKVSIRFFSFAHYRSLLASEEGELTPARGILAGSLAGLTESIIAVTPTERLKILLIESARNQFVLYKGESYGYRCMSQRQNFRGLYQGLVLTILKQSSTQGVKMGSYNALREHSRRHDIPQTGTTAFVTGALAGIITVYVTQPFDTVKTCAQSTRGAGTIAAFQTVVKRKGVCGLWSGSTSRMGRLAFSSSILYTVYEKVATTINGSLEKELFVFESTQSIR